MSNMTILLIVVCITAALAVTELVSLFRNRSVGFRCEVDMKLVEPGEVITLTYHVQNTSFFPMPFFGFCFCFPEELQVAESEEWMQSHRVGGSYSNMYSIDLPLKPHRGARGRLHIAVKKRGLHELGRVYIETGDFLGFRSKVRTQTLSERIVCTAAAMPLDSELESVGGFLGDISVRRFIMEDPSLILGYRDYTGAEPMKSISWAQSARTGALIVKKHDYTVDTDVSILVSMELCQAETAERCLSLLRTVCDLLEARKMSYALVSNGDLLTMQKGCGRQHSLEIQRRIGLSRFTRFYPMESLLNQWNRPGFSQRGYIVIAPRRSEQLEPLLRRLEQNTGARVCLLTGEEV